MEEFCPRIGVRRIEEEEFCPRIFTDWHGLLEVD